MENHSLLLLEFAAIKKTLKDICMSDDGREFLEKQDFFYENEALDAYLDSLKALRELILQSESQPSADFPAINKHMHPLRKAGSVIEAEELAACARYFSSAEAWRRFVQKESGSSVLSEVFADYSDLSELSKTIFKCIEPDGSIRESDIPVLRNIKKSMNRVRTEIQSAAESYLSDPGKSRYWSSDLATQKEGRTVLPLKSSHKGRVDGVVHETSASGSTVFIEPFEIVEKNNHLVELEQQYRRELFNILKELSSLLHNSYPEIEKLVTIIAYFDGLYAKARYSIYYSCSRPELSSNRMVLKEARHPLLGKSAVPITIDVSPPVRTLIITGPNTGGKTVSLKTAGLLSLMLQFGMEIPAAEGSCLPLFDGVFCDIGDEQSIEQSLSTFSGHMTNIARILKKSSDRSLILLDELGAGTDPEEGAALAVSILDYLCELQPMTLITTHHGVLKKYGYTKEHVENASMEFSEKNLKPTFHVIAGLPGASRAIEVAEDTGIPSAIIAKARHYLESRETDSAKIIKDLIKKEGELYRYQHDLKDEQEKLNALRTELEEKESDLEKREISVAEGKIEELNRLLDESRSKIERSIEEIRTGEISREKTKKVKSVIEEIEKERSEQKRALERKKKKKMTPPPSIEEGMEIRIRSTGKTGRVVRQDGKNRWTVSVGSMKISLPDYELEAVQSQEPREKKADVLIEGDHSPEIPAFTVDLRGKRLDEAVSIVEKQIDRALYAGFTEFGIIHGTGEGVLQTGVRRLLKKSPHVEHFSFAGPQDGGFGKTYVRLK
jgi:DNA mismatch repair protein MutS2